MIKANIVAHADAASPDALRSFARAVLAQTRAELILTARRGESVLITIIVPAVLLVFFAALRLVPAGFGKPIDYLLPGMIGLAIMSTGMVSLGIATAYERHYGILKRLGSSPLPRGGLLLAKALAVLVVEVAQIVLLLALAIGLYGWTPRGNLWLTLLAVVLGSVCFAGLGMVMAGTLRAEATLAGANALYLIFLMLGGSVLPIDHLPGFLQDLARILPAFPLTDLLRGAMTGSGTLPLSSFIWLVAWAVIFLGTAARAFRWE